MTATTLRARLLDENTVLEAFTTLEGWKDDGEPVRLRPGRYVVVDGPIVEERGSYIVVENPFGLMAEEVSVDADVLEPLFDDFEEEGPEPERTSRIEANGDTEGDLAIVMVWTGRYEGGRDNPSNWTRYMLDETDLLALRDGIDRALETLRTVWDLSDLEEGARTGPFEFHYGEARVLGEFRGFRYESSGLPARDRRVSVLIETDSGRRMEFPTDRNLRILEVR